VDDPPGGPVATPGADFETVEGTVTFDPGETAGQVSIPIADDTHFEPTEHFTVSFINASGDARLSGQPRVTVRILDDDPPDLTLGGKRLQRPLRRGAVTVLATPSPGSRLRASGTITLPGRTRLKLRDGRILVPQGRTRLLALRLHPAGKRKLRKAFGVRKRFSAKLTVTATVSGRSTVATRRVRLRR
jgi:hypothetical protein